MADDYEVIMVGGGIGGAALAQALAKNGMRVLVLESETAFRDRVRGEYVHPWGVTEAKTLGLYELLKQTCGYEARWRVNRVFGIAPTPPRDMVATSPHQTGSLHFYHPAMQQVVLDAAVRVGAVVQRGVTVVEVLPGPTPAVRAQSVHGEYSYTARLVVGSDGRMSACRKWGRFSVRRDPDRLVIAGLLFDRFAGPEDAVDIFANPELSQFAIFIPLGSKRFRCYTGYYQQPGRRRLSGGKAVDAFIAHGIASGAPADWFAGALPVLPLASFDGADTWVSHPYQAGVALIGDAASASDPTFGCGLSQALRDARILSNLLLTEGDWDAAAHAYADEHDLYFGSIHRQLDWLTKLYYEPGQAAAERRARAFARLAEDPKRAPDIAGLGPESPSDDSAYRNLFGDD